MKKHPFAVGTFGGIIGTPLVAIAAWLAVAHSGALNVAATDGQADVVRWTPETILHRPVSGRTDDVELPEISDDLTAEAAGHYSESWVLCHGAPGEGPAEWPRGIQPEPPHMVEAATEWATGGTPWIAETGIKMSGTRAFGPCHGSEEYTAVAAVVSQLPALSAEDDAALTGGHHEPWEPSRHSRTTSKARYQSCPMSVSA